MAITRKMLLELFEYQDGALILKKKRNHGAKVGDAVGTLQKNWVSGCMFRAETKNHSPPCIFDAHENLRPATRTENNRNIGLRKNNKLGVKGVYLQQGFYRSRICVNRKIIELGLHKTIQEAKTSYDLAAKKYHGEFANLGVAQ